MRTLISGASGLVGSTLVESLFKKGHTIRCLQRNKGPDSDRLWNIEDLGPSAEENGQFNTVVHLAGENIAQGRWNKTKRERIIRSRVDGTRQLVDFINLMESPPTTLICASAIGYYGNRGNELLTETSRAGTGFLSEVCQQWEAEAANAANLKTRVVYLRLGMVLSPAGGALHKMLKPFKAGLGGVLGNGQQYLSWVSIRDIVEIIDFVINNENIHGPVNVVAPTSVTNKEFTHTLGAVIERPTILPAPAFGLRLAFGEMANEMLLASTRVSPEKLIKAGYSFLDKDLKDTLTYCINESVEL